MPETVRLSDWYELVSGAELTQGDILEGCPVFRPPVDLMWPLEDNRTYEFQATFLDVVIMTQSCDLVEGHKLGLSLILLCPVWRLSSAADVNPFLGSNHGKEQCRRGHLPAYHMIDRCEHERWT